MLGSYPEMGHEGLLFSIILSRLDITDWDEMADGMGEREMCDSSVSTGIFTLTDCLKAVAVRGGAEQTAVHHSYIPTVTTSRATSRAQLQPASHSIPIRPGLISISVVTAARGLGGWLGPHSPSVRAQTEPHLPPSQPSHRSRPKLFSYFSCDSLPYSQRTGLYRPVLARL